MPRDKKGRFIKGSTPHNTGKRLKEYIEEGKIEKIKKTQFKRGQTAGEKSNTWKGGIQTPKGDCVHLYDGVGKRKRRPRAIYEEYFGKIPKGYIIYHMDGDKNNDDPYNLEAISRKELLRRNRFKE
jgi:hypothetical protein